MTLILWMRIVVAKIAVAVAARLTVKFDQLTLLWGRVVALPVPRVQNIPDSFESRDQNNRPDAATAPAASAEPQAA